MTTTQTLHPATAALVRDLPELATRALTDENLLESLMRFDRLAHALPTLDALAAESPMANDLVDARIRAEGATIRRLLDQAA